MQAAAPTEQTQTAAASLKGRISAKASIKGIPAPGIKTAAAAARKTGARATKATGRFAVLEALQKALKEGSQKGQPAGSPGSIHASAGHPGPSLSGKAGAAQALLAAGDQKNSSSTAHAEEVAEGRKAAGKKIPHAAPGSATAESLALSLARELVKTFENPAATQKAADAQDTEKKSGAAQAATQKTADPRVHVVDTRHKEAGKPADGSAVFEVKLQRPAATVQDASLPLLHRLEADRDLAPRETPKPQAPAGSPLPGAVERLREMAGSELLRATGIILRDGGGEIKLVLKPESLGSVRIRMNLVDNAIEGRIIVDNQAVKQVFDGNMNALTRALQAEGFQTASLQVSVGGQNADNGREERDPPQRVRRVSVEGFERNVPGLENISLGDQLVNLFV